VQDEHCNYMFDPAYSVNPAPHWWNVTTVDGAETSREAHSWGRVPWVPLYNNAEASSDLGGQDENGQPCGIKSLIDAYDMISSATTNDQIDLVALYWVVKGFGGETAREIVKRLQMNRVVNVSGGEPGDVSRRSRSRFLLRNAASGWICSGMTFTILAWGLIQATRKRLRD
jgi:hypothetical protein